MIKGFNLVFFLALTSNYSYGIDYGVFRQISDINNQSFFNTNRDCLQNLVSPFSFKTKNNIEYNECALSLCGQPNTNSSAWLTDTSKSTSLTPQLKNKINELNPIISKVLKKSKDENLKELDNLSKSISNIDSLDINKFSSTFKEELNTLVFSPYIKEEINPNAGLNEKINFKLVNTNGLSENYIESLKAYAENLKKQSYLNYFSYKEKNLFSINELKVLAQKSIEETIKSIEKYKGELTETQLVYFNKSIKEAKNNLESISNISSFTKIYSDLDYIDGNLALTHPDETFRTSNAQCSTESCSKTIKEFLKKQDLQKGINKLKQDLENPEKEKSSMNRCKAALASSLITESNQEKAREVFENAKDAIIQNVLPRFSAHSRKMLKDYLTNKLKFSADNYQKKFVFKNLDLITKFKKVGESYLNDQEENYVTTYELENNLRNALLANSNINTIDAFSSINSPCSSTLTSNAWDSFLPIDIIRNKSKEPNFLKEYGKGDVVFVSDFSCSHEAGGKHMIAHEIGHALNSFFATNNLSSESAKLYKSIRNCVTENYTDALSSKYFLSHPGDSKYSEEDMADLIAVLSNPKEKKIFSCFLLKPDISNEGYMDLSFIDDQDDPHSTEFSRVIFEAINKEVELPVSCTRIINQDKPKMRFKKCF